MRLAAVTNFNMGDLVLKDHFGSKNTFYVQTWVEEMYSFRFFVTIIIWFGAKSTLPDNTWVRQKVRHFAWSCQMKQKALRDHGDYRNYTPEIYHRLCN